MDKQQFTEKLYDWRGDLLGAMSENSNTAHAGKVSAISEQLRLIENITDAAQDDYFERLAMERESADIEQWLGDALDQARDPQDLRETQQNALY